MGDALGVVPITVNGINWLIVPEEEQEIRCAFEERSGDGRLLRATPHRRVIWMEGERHALVVKHFYHAGLGTFLKSILRGSPAALEWKALHEARDRGLTVPRPIALGRRGWILSRESLLVTEALKGAVDLAEYLFGPNRPTGIQRREAIRKIANFIRKTHDLGIYHRDLHLGNILVGGNGKEIYLLDFQRVQFSRSLNPALRWRNLAALNGGCLDASTTDKIHFLKTYLTLPSPLAFDLRSLAARLERKGRRHRARVWRSRLKRCLAENREFMCVRWDGFSGVVRRDHGSGPTFNVLRSPWKLLTQPGVRLVKDSRTTTVGMLSSPGVNLCIKRYNFQGMGYAFKDLFRSSRARRAWIVANGLRMRGISVALPIAYLERRRFRVLLDSFVVAVALDGQRLDEVLDGFVLFHRFSEKHRLIRDLAVYVKRMHERGAAHRDLKSQNIIVQLTDRGQYQFYLVDYDGVRLGPASWHRRVKNLLRLARSLIDCEFFTERDRLRLIRDYFGRKSRDRWRKVWRKLRK